MNDLQGKRFVYLFGMISLFQLVTEIHGNSDSSNQSDQEHYCLDPNGEIDFKNFDNSVGTENGCFVVPNYVHFIRSNGTNFTYLDMIVVMAAFKRQKPEKMFIHYDNKTSITGKYWDILNTYPGFKKAVQFEKLEMPNEIFGQKLGRKYHVYHASDISALRILMKHGGIFLQNDMYLVKPLHGYRRFEMTLGWNNEANISLGTEIILAHKDARLLKLWLESYKGNYHDDLYYNSRRYPSKEIIRNNPKLVHMERYLFGNDEYAPKIYTENWEDWNRYFYAHHLLINARSTLINHEKEKEIHAPDVYNETSVLEATNTLRSMCLDVYNPTNFTMK